MQSQLRTAIGLVLAPWLVLSSVAAPEHLHEADAHHSNAVAHRHIAPHSDDGDEGAEISHGEGQVIWLDDVAISQATYEISVTQAVTAAEFETLPEPTGWFPASVNEAAPAHGPPRSAASLRAPPSLSI